MTDYQPWHPINKPVDLKALGKLSEECGEAVQAVSRCIIQGMDEYNEKEGKSNRAVLEEEIADVLCNIEIVTEHFNLDKQSILNRIYLKKPKLKQWHGMT